MTEVIPFLCDSTNVDEKFDDLNKLLEKGAWVQLIAPQEKRIFIESSCLPAGPGIVVSSGGSSGRRHHCLHPCNHLDQSAFATGKWLEEQGIDPHSSFVFNPLPMHHLSGLMPWWRSRSWGAEHVWIKPSLIHEPNLLFDSFRQLFQEMSTRSTLLSLVPTQLHRLMSKKEGVEWLKIFDVIWVGGSALSSCLARQAISEGIRLAPCYGATETAAMITALSPNEFLAGLGGCGGPLHDVELSLGDNGALKVRTPRLAVALFSDDGLVSLRDKEGWWSSSDWAELSSCRSGIRLSVLGRMDLAVHSGGETVFPEELEAKLLSEAIGSGFPIEALLFLPVQDAEWGQRLVALVRFSNETTSPSSSLLLQSLKELVSTWLPAERPVQWHICPPLAPNQLGKWERALWEAWLQAKN